MEHWRAHVYSHNPVVWPAGCRLAAGAIGRLSVAVVSGAVAIIKTYKTHIYGCTQKCLYANAKLRTVKRLVARMNFTDNVRMSRS
jgi:hypothetical protein